MTTQTFTVVDRSKSSDYRRVAGDVPKSIALQFKHKCSLEEITLAEGLEAALRKWLGDEEEERSDLYLNQESDRANP